MELNYSNIQITGGGHHQTPWTKVTPFLSKAAGFLQELVVGA